ncbi:hypothetical protein GCM10009626_19000 [Brachybacterium sacelli]
MRTKRGQSATEFAGPDVDLTDDVIQFADGLPRSAAPPVVFVVFEDTMDAMNDIWLTTGETATLLGVSRQHVVDLCDRGELVCTKAGTHRRIRRSEVQRLFNPQLTREQEKSLWLHRALMGHLMLDPQKVLQMATENITRWKPKHRADGIAMRSLEQWEQVLSGGVDVVVDVLTGLDEVSSDLRQNSPFAGVLSDVERRQALRSFREHWDHEHTAA